jgi:hypothetical protein
MHAFFANNVGSDFDAFLSAQIGEERNGMTLSVISALARLGLDPWHEAAQLDSLPDFKATERMASLIAALPDGLVAHRNSGSIAAHLIALLPRRSANAAGSVSRKTLLNADEATQFRAGTFMYVCLMLFMLAAQWIVSGVQPAAQAGDAAASSSSIAADPPHLNPGVSEK